MVVDGFKRLKWLQENGTVEVECLLYEADSDRRSLTLQRLEAKMVGAVLNLAEKAQIVAKLAGLMPAEQIRSEYFPILKLALRSQAVERWSRVAAAEDLMLSALANDRLGERVVLELIDWPEAERGKIIALFCELRCSASIQMEIVERVSEIALRQGRNRSEIQASPEVQDILKDPDRNHRQKTQALRDLLQSWRFPRWWARQEHFERSLGSAELPAQIGIAPPPAFEGNSWRCRSTLVVDEPETRRKYNLPAGLSGENRREIQQTLESEGQLYVRRHPKIRFRSKRITLEKEGQYIVTGDLELRGVTQVLSLSVQAELHEPLLRAKGSGRFLQSSFGYRPYSAFWGTVRNQDEVILHVDIVAVRQ